jgi:hypothetical protein
MTETDSLNPDKIDERSPLLNGEVNNAINGETNSAINGETNSSIDTNRQDSYEILFAIINILIWFFFL